MHRKTNPNEGVLDFTALINKYPSTPRRQRFYSTPWPLFSIPGAQQGYPKE